MGGARLDWARGRVAQTPQSIARSLRREGWVAAERAAPVPEWTAPGMSGLCGDERCGVAQERAGRVAA